MTVAARGIRGRIERHLGPEADDALFAKCMTSICEGHPPDCSFYHACLHDGDCFKGSPFLAAARKIESLASREEGDVAAFLRAAAKALRDGDVNIRSAEVTPFA